MDSQFCMHGANVGVKITSSNFPPRKIDKNKNITKK